MPSRKSNAQPCTCQNCGNTFMPRYGRANRFCSRKCYYVGKVLPPATRFLRNVSPPNERGCTLWTGFRDPKGYGRFAPSGTHATLAHRWSYEQRFGKIPPGLAVCHRCDVPACVNPDHLFVGTIIDNNADCKAKGRVAHGGAHGHAKLTEADVVTIRRLASQGEKAVALAARYGVVRNTIYRVISPARKHWSHV